MLPALSATSPAREAAVSGSPDAPTAPKVDIDAIGEETRAACIRTVAGHVQFLFNNELVQTAVRTYQKAPNLLTNVVKSMQEEQPPQEVAVLRYLVERALAGTKPLLQFEIDAVVREAPDEAFQVAFKNILLIRDTPQAPNRLQQCCKELLKIHDCNLADLMDELNCKKNRAVMVTPTDDAKQKTDAYINGLYKQFIGMNPQVTMMLLASKAMPALYNGAKETLKKFEEMAKTAELSAVYSFTSQGLVRTHKGFVETAAKTAEVWKGISDEAIEVSVKAALLPKLPEIAATLARTSPAMLQEMVETMPCIGNIIKDKKL